MKMACLLMLLTIVACQSEPGPDEHIIQSDDYVLVEFAARLEEAEHLKSTGP